MQTCNIRLKNIQRKIELVYNFYIDRLDKVLNSNTNNIINSINFCQVKQIKSINQLIKKVL